VHEVSSTSRITLQQGVRYLQNIRPSGYRCKCNVVTPLKNVSSFLVTMFATLTNTEALCTGRLHRSLPKSTKNVESSVFYLLLRQVRSALQIAVEGMLAINRCRIFCLPVCYPKIQIL